MTTPPHTLPTAEPGPLRPLAVDLGARDSTVVINSYTTVLRRSAVAHDMFAAYWRDVHGPLCSRIPGLGWYVQHHFARRQDAHLWPAAGPGPLPGYVLDGAVEIGFSSAQEQGVFQDASPVLFSDEQNVFDETIAYALPQGSRTLVDRLVDPVPNGPDVVDRLHVHLSPRDGAVDEATAFVADQLAPALAAHPEVLKLRVHLPDSYDNDRPNPPAPNVAHTVPAQRASLVVLELAVVDPLARRRLFESDAFQSTVEGQARLFTHITAFPVAGVHTFVRDGVLTTAGLRGSRVAELITAVAALNQVSPDVRQLMATGAPAA